MMAGLAAWWDVDETVSPTGAACDHRRHWGEKIDTL